MPAVYAHYTFGRQVLAQLSPSIQQLLTRSPLHKQLFAVGLQGPDILFFYRPYPNRLSRQGGEIHEKPAADFLRPLLEGLDPSEEEDELLLCYLLGFTCHFALDSQCHPYIARRLTQADVTHHQIESEFDRMLMEEHGKDPLRFNPACYLHPDEDQCRIIARAYPELTPRHIRQCMNGWLILRDLLTSRSGARRAVLGGATRAVGLGGLVLPALPSPRCLVSNRELRWLYDTAVGEAASLVGAVYRTAHSGAPLPVRFQRNFA